MWPGGTWNTRWRLRSPIGWFHDACVGPIMISLSVVYKRTSRVARHVDTSYVIVPNCFESSTIELGEVKSSFMM